MRYLLVLLVLSVPCAAQTFSDRESLRGLSGVPVKVTVPQGTGLSPMMIGQFVELKLRAAHITVPAVNPPRLEDGGAVLLITVVSTQEGNLSEMTVRLSRLVRLIRKPSIEVYATTWEMSQSGGHDKSNEHNIKQSLDWFLNSFIEDYLAVNQK